ncbi:MAG TPA: translocation/assembly module TamB domain-containing protein, partial [Chthoniobacterales bacterium]|nr:translocation/assembly module TamB domain-containing protein [Chthoniobacterales bacterium]
PGGNLEFTANEIDGAALNRLGRVNAKANIKLADQRLSVDATIRQRQTKPLHIVGNVPFDAVRFIREKQFDTSAPVEATITLPRSSIAFLSKMVPQIRYAEGTIALNAKVTGSIRDPELSGSLRVHFPALRAKSTSVPNISDGDVTIRLHDRTVSIEQAQMRIAGGRLSMSGSAQFDELTKPVLDIQIQGKSVLVARNESLNVRANADLSLTGPLAKAKVTGNIGITQSRFLKDIEILPISLPGRPVPRPGLPHESSTASIDTPPLRDWSFDVAIKTDEPFKVRGNLAHGNVVADLKLTGTGKQPSLEGTAWLKDFVVSLPFSRLRITRGSAYFTPGGAIANPKIDLNGVSEIRDHLVNVYVYGTASDPKTVFTSSPPMPQEDIISLLATGVTREEFMANGGRAAAGRASWLALKGLYQKFFPGTPGSSENDFFDRFEFDLGGVDPRTGQQRLVTRFEVSDHWMLVGTTSLEGGFQGKLKYVIRFR